MPARKHTQWLAKPSVDYVDSRIYSDWDIHYEEQEKIFKKVWIPVCHESELPNHLDFRTSSIAGSKVAMIRDKERVIAFEHNFQSMPVSGNLTSDGGFDHWNCPELPCEVKFGGMVWVTLNLEPTQDVEGWAAGAFDCIGPALDEEPLEVFHYHKGIIGSNYKLWHDTNSEFYHDYMHYFNRVTGFTEEYFARKNIGFPNGHVNVGSFTVQYDQFDGADASADRTELSFPHIPPNSWFMVDLFPGMNFNLRGSALRTDIVTPLGPDKVMIEFRGFGLKRDTPEERNTRIKHHNTIWGPFGRNLHEDLIGIQGQGVSMAPGTEHRHILHGRKENDTIHDEVGMRHYYHEWGEWMGRDPTNPMRENAIWENNEDAHI